MLGDDAWDRVADRIQKDDFYRHDHRLIFEAASTNQPRDISTVTEWLTSRAELENLGGLTYPATLANQLGSDANVQAYADIAQERSTDDADGFVFWTH